MSGKRYSDEFKIEAVRQVVDRGHSVSSVARRLGVTTKSLYDWISRFGKPDSQHSKLTEQEKEIRKLKSELKRVTDERDILKKAAAYFAKESR
ncbi:MAG: transposase [Zetaproteobacteria bacterium CG2_30_59_37]|nr:MAG: transposase [Zetaproteobacteria bacterium CG2_30_59_37]